MKLSEAMALGRVLLKPKAMFLTDGEGSGCALGMALTAIGVKIEKPSFIEEPEKQWPWLKKSCERPCSCGGSYFSYTQAIAHIFDDHVMKGYWESWTLDELIDWIKSVELAEEPKRRKKNQKQDKTEASRATKEITLQI